RLRLAGQGLLRGSQHGGVRPVSRVLPLEPARQAVAGPRPAGGVPPGDRRLGGADPGEQRDADARGFLDLAGGVPVNGGGAEEVLPGVRAETGHGGDASGVRVSDELLAHAGGAGADAGGVRARVGAGVHGVHGALTGGAAMESWLVSYDIS